MTVAFKIDFNKFVKVKRLEKVDGIPDDYSVYCCDIREPEKIDKIFLTSNHNGEAVIVFQPLSYYEDIEIDTMLCGEDSIQKFTSNDFVFVALPPKEALQCDYFWTLQKLPQILEKMEEI